MCVPIYTFAYEYMYIHYICVCVHTFNSIKSLSNNCPTCARHSEEDLRFLYGEIAQSERIEKKLRKR